MCLNSCKQNSRQFKWCATLESCYLKSWNQSCEHWQVTNGMSAVPTWTEVDWASGKMVPFNLTREPHQCAVLSQSTFSAPLASLVHWIEAWKQNENRKSVKILCCFLFKKKKFLFMAKLTKQSLFMMRIWHCSRPNHGVGVQCVHADLTQWCVCNPTNVGLGLGFGHISWCIGPWTPRTYIIQFHNGHNIGLWTHRHMLPPIISCQLARLSASTRNRWFMTDCLTQWQ